MAAIPKPLRQYIVPQLGDDWAGIAARVFPTEPATKTIAALQSWNPHIAFRPPTGIGMLPSDVVFIEPSSGL